MVGLFDTDTEGDSGYVPAPAKGRAKVSSLAMAGGKKAGGRAAATTSSGGGNNNKNNKVTKPATAASASSSQGRRNSGRIAALSRAAEREVLGDRTNRPVGGKSKPAGGKAKAKAAVLMRDDEDASLLEDDSELMEQPAVAKRRGSGGGGAPTKVAARKAVGAKRAARREEEDEDEYDDMDAVDVVEEAPVAQRARGAGGGKSKAAAQEEPEEDIADEDAMDLDDEGASGLSKADGDTTTGLVETAPAAARDKRRAATTTTTTTTTGRGVTLAATASKSAASSATAVVAAESDSSLRRRLGEATLRSESLEMKYRDLREVAVREAERNFDRLKRQSEERAGAAKELIGTLKSELTAQTLLAREGERHAAALAASREAASALEARVAELTRALAEARGDAKALNARVAVMRGAVGSGAVEVNGPGGGRGGGGVPGGAAAGGQGQGHQALWPAPAGEAAQKAQMKEDLYADLTGLIVMGVKRDGADQVYDCIQTGRNGTLHFKLVNTSSEDSTSDVTAAAADRAECVYMPQLDASRDRELVGLLPDFLTEEIRFPRQHAAKFYARVMKALTERVD